MDLCAEGNQIDRNPADSVGSATEYHSVGQAAKSIKSVQSAPSNLTPTKQSIDQSVARYLATLASQGPFMGFSKEYSATIWEIAATSYEPAAFDITGKPGGATLKQRGEVWYPS